MKHKFCALGLMSLVFLLVVSCQNRQKSSESWSGEMQNMSQDIKLLVPYVYQTEKFKDPKNEATIQRALDELATHAHKVPEDMGKSFLGDDPILSYSLENLQSDLLRSSQSFRQGQKDYSQNLIKSSIGHCFRCHSLTEVGAKARWDIANVDQLQMNATEKVDLLVATRKYDEAFKFLESEIVKPDLLQKTPFIFEGLLRKYMALAVRLQDTPGKALSRLELVIKDRELPPYLKAQVKAWRDSLTKWDKGDGASKDFISAAQAKIREARRLQTFAYDHAGDVEYLRATKILHKGLLKKNSDPRTAAAYLLLGQSYEVLDDLGSYKLHETYYEACIKKAPKEKTARNCYNRLEASLVEGYSGTSGLSLPKEERDRLNKLRTLL